MLVVGLMSGTSADGIDAAICEFDGTAPKIEVKIHHALIHPYPDGFQQRIHEACIPEKSNVTELCLLNFEQAELYAEAALRVIEKASLQPSDIDLIGSHGQTYWHHVAGNGDVTATLQLVDGSILAERTGITTINNFRTRDVAVGGQGAPLTGYADWLLLRHETKWRAVQNIGGIGNVTFLPPLTDNKSNPLAFDTGPGNMLLDTILVALTEGQQTYDKDGQMAQQGRIDEEWLADLLEHPYYDRRPPKTTGRELFGEVMAQELIVQAKHRDRPLEDIMATLTFLTAQTIADAYTRYAPKKISEVILGGGGRNNPTMVKLIQDFLPYADVLTHEDIGLDSDNKEALVFALLAYETWHNRPGNHPSLTGASHPTVLGQITPSNNYVELIRQTWCNDGN